MSIGVIVSTLSKLVGAPQLPEPGKSKFVYQDHRYSGNVTVGGILAAESVSAFMKETGHFGDVYFLPNPLSATTAIPPNLIGTSKSFIVAWGGIFTTEVSSLKGVNSLTGKNTLTGETYLNGTVFLNGLNLSSEIELAKQLPPPSSDEQLKENISTIENSIDKVNALRGVDFNWKKDGKKQIGVIAQEVEKILPELVETMPDGYKGVHYGNIVGLLIEAIKEQQKEINELKEKINA